MRVSSCCSDFKLEPGVLESVEPEFPFEGFDVDADWISRLSLDSVADGSVESSDDRLNLVSKFKFDNNINNEVFKMDFKLKIYIKKLFLWNLSWFDGLFKRPFWVQQNEIPKSKIKSKIGTPAVIMAIQLFKTFKVVTSFTLQYIILRHHPRWWNVRLKWPFWSVFTVPVQNRVALVQIQIAFWRGLKFTNFRIWM